MSYHTRTAKKNGIGPFRYLRYLFEQLPDAHDSASAETVYAVVGFAADR
ncbi:transposase domain-containing protein [Paenibacillus sepulcri]|uniref:Transposase domain-containing protein n=1 Tax=Paenibacillus sepulcri TaxID=359917 RepID=A0ABS7BZB3_9BACL|nr:transposase domain-containing protein [Paenibacillus sepulcri]